jgi:hypothetical protein
MFSLTAADNGKLNVDWVELSTLTFKPVKMFAISILKRMGLFSQAFTV